MQIYFEGSCLYGFDPQRVLEAKYKARYTSINLKYGKYNKNNVEQKANEAIKS